MQSLFPKKLKSWRSEDELFSFIDLFSGIGGFRIALEGLGGSCKFSSEINEECIKTYATNFNEYPDGDITQIDLHSIPDHEILCAGFPCQPFSISGKQKGFEDTRGTLFFNILEIIKEKKPKVVFLENVKHLKHHDGGKTLKIILKNIEQLGYKTSWSILNAKDFGLAQNRERIIIIASKKFKFDFLQIKSLPQIKIADILDSKGNFIFIFSLFYAYFCEFACVLFY